MCRPRARSGTSAGNEPSGHHPIGSHPDTQVSGITSPTPERKAPTVVSPIGREKRDRDGRPGLARSGAARRGGRWGS